MNPEQIKELDSVNMPLEGITLIEAAAGTGKTHNIQNIAARLIVEKNFAINRIVIVTFTELAAKELAERLRSVLESLAKVLQGETLADVSQQKRSEELLHSFDRHGIEAKDQLERVKNALADFDDNRVSTIHGFCARILNENAFESSVLFRTRLEKNIDQYVDKLLGDFCRIHKPQTAILCVPDDSAKELVAQLYKLGVHSFWNFTHYDILTDFPDALVENVHLSDSLMTLSYQIKCNF